jgi:hypothetical protein
MNIDPSQKESNVHHGSSEELQESIYPVQYPHHHEFNQSAGSEFLDEALRMKEQPFGETNSNDNE